MKQLLYLLLICLFCLNISTFTQNPEWINYTTSNSGIPHNRTTCIAIDESGTKWIGTEGGLAKFDGSNWEVYNESNTAFPSNRFSCIAIDNDGTIWLGTYGYGLVEFDGISVSTYNTSNSGLPSNSILDIAIDSQGNKWIATTKNYSYRGDGLIKLDYLTWEITVYDTLTSGIPGDNVSCIEIDEFDNVWIGTCSYGYGGACGGRGMAKFDGTNWTVFNEDNSGLPSNSIVDIAIDKSGDKWVLSGRDLTKYDESNWIDYPDTVEHDGFCCLAIDSKDNKFVGRNANSRPSGLGMLMFDDSEWTSFSTDNSDIPSNHICYITVDKFNNKWIGTNFYGGLSVFNENGVVTDVKNNVDLETMPKDYVLYQNYPNPFNPSTTIKYEIPDQVRNDNVNVRLIVYDILGREVATLVNEQQKPGYYEVNFNASSLTSGIYFYKLNASSFVETKKMILLR